VAVIELITPAGLESACKLFSKVVMSLSIELMSLVCV